MLCKPGLYQTMMRKKNSLLLNLVLILLITIYANDQFICIYCQANYYIQKFDQNFRHVLLVKSALPLRVDSMEKPKQLPTGGGGDATSVIDLLPAVDDRQKVVNEDLAKVLVYTNGPVLLLTDHERCHRQKHVL